MVNPPEEAVDVSDGVARVKRGVQPPLIEASPGSPHPWLLWTTADGSPCSTQISIRYEARPGPESPVRFSQDGICFTNSTGFRARGWMPCVDGPADVSCHTFELIVVAGENDLGIASGSFKLLRDFAVHGAKKKLFHYTVRGSRAEQQLGAAQRGLSARPGALFPVAG